MSTMSLAISGTSIRQDSFGRFCLNDLHKASGGEKRHSPNYWLAIQQTKELIEEITKSTTDIPVVEQNQTVKHDTDITVSKFSPVEIVQGRGKVQGTFVVKELVYAYATWISAKFFLSVIRAYDAIVSKPVPNALRDLPPKTTLDDAEMKTLTNAIKAACFSNGVFDRSKYTTELGKLTTAYGKRKIEQLPTGKVNEMLAFLGLRVPEPNELVLIPAKELAELKNKSQSTQRTQTEFSGFGYASMVLGVNDDSRLLIQPHGDMTAIMRLRPDDFAGTFETIVRELKMRGYHVIKDSPENKLETIGKIVSAKFEA